MRVACANVFSETRGVWKTSIDPLSLDKLNRPIHQYGALNVVIVSKPQFDEGTRSLHFDSETAVFLNRGNTCETVFIKSIEKNLYPEFTHANPGQQKEIGGDQAFLFQIQGLGETQMRIGREILLRVRKHYNGRLIHHQGTGNFVESPDRFWSIQIKTHSYRVIVFGKPDDHGHKHCFELEPYMGSYSSFFISDNYQIDATIRTIIDAMRYKKIRFS